MTAIRELSAELLRFHKIDVPDREVISRRKLCRKGSGEPADNAVPLTLRSFVLRRPKASREFDFDLIFARSPFRLVAGTPH